MTRHDTSCVCLGILFWFLHIYCVVKGSWPCHGQLWQVQRKKWLVASSETRTVFQPLFVQVLENKYSRAPLSASSLSSVSMISVSMTVFIHLILTLSRAPLYQNNQNIPQVSGISPYPAPLNSHSCQLLGVLLYWDKCRKYWQILWVQESPYNWATYLPRWSFGCRTVRYWSNYPHKVVKNDYTNYNMYIFNLWEINKNIVWIRFVHFVELYFHLRTVFAFDAFNTSYIR